MKWSKILTGEFGKSEDFAIGEDNFSDLQVNPTATGNFYYFYNQKDRRLIKQFVLLKKRTRRLCLSCCTD
jgi:hypothetical protein